MKSLLLLGLLALASNVDVSKVEETYQATDTLKAEFTQSTYVDMLDKTITRPGRIFYQKGGKLRIEYAGDKMTHYISDGDTLWIFDPKTKQVETFMLKDSGLPEEALKFLTELGNLREYFTVSSNKNRKTVLKPKRKSTYKFLEAVFGDNHYLKELTIHTASGNTSNYRFFNLQTGGRLPPQLFQPNR